MTNRAWAMRFMRDVLWEVSGEVRFIGIVHTDRRRWAENMAHRNFSRDIERLTRRLAAQYDRGWSDKP